jgi:DNA adenine methylase
VKKQEKATKADRENPAPTPAPFVKWAGGKRQILSVIKANLPENFERYLEVFLGGGAVFFNLTSKFSAINDINRELINAYRTIKSDVDGMIKELRKHQKNNTKKYFYRIRKKSPKDMTKVERAARFIYLNKTCFNGLYRENSKGLFNVPFGKYSNPNICDESNLRAVSRYLNSTGVKIESLPYNKFILKHAQPGDFIYLDPPYYPMKETSFTKYHKGKFLEAEQVELCELYKALDKRGCKVLLSNSNSPFIKQLYAGFNIVEVSASRAVNSDSSKRGKSKIEVLVRNY